MPDTSRQELAGHDEIVCLEKTPRWNFKDFEKIGCELFSCVVSHSLQISSNVLDAKKNSERSSELSS